MVALKCFRGIHRDRRSVVALLIGFDRADLVNGSDVDVFGLGDMGLDGHVNGVALRRG